MRNKTDQYYISAVLKGDSQAFAFLLQKYQNMVYTVVLRVVKAPEDAEEVTQDAFIKAYKNLGKFKGASKFSTWLYQIAYHEAISRFRKHKLEATPIEEMPRDLIQQDFTDGWNHLKNEQQREFLHMALEKLDPTDRVLVTLYYLEDHSVEELVKVSGLSVSNVKVKLFRVRKKLLQELERLLGSEVHSLM